MPKVELKRRFSLVLAMEVTKRPVIALIDDLAGTAAEFDQILTAEFHVVFQINADDLRLAQRFRFSRRK